MTTDAVKIGCEREIVLFRFLSEQAFLAKEQEADSLLARSAKNCRFSAVELPRSPKMLKNEQLSVLLLDHVPLLSMLLSIFSDGIMS